MVEVTEEHRLTVEEAEFPPRIIVPPMGHVILPGDTVQLYCEVDAYPPATIGWFRNNVAIDSQSESGVEITCDENKSWLTLRAPLPGLYTAVASNALGQDEASALIEIQGMMNLHNSV